jgi:hypothetical protein
MTINADTTATGKPANQYLSVVNFTVSVKRLLTTAIPDETVPCSLTDCLQIAFTGGRFGQQCFPTAYRESPLKAARQAFR